MVITSDTTVSTRTVIGAAAEDRTYEIADGAALSFANSASAALNGAAFSIGNGRTLLIGPAVSSGTVRFVGNRTSGTGGVIFSTGTIDITNALFSSNTTFGQNRHGGAIATSGNGAVILSNVRFEENHAGAEDTNGAFGGAIYMTGANASVSITNGEFINNRANSHGGAIYVASGSISLQDVLLKGNYNIGTKVSGAMQLNAATAKAALANVIFEGNHTGVGGNTGAIRNAGILGMTGGRFSSNYSDLHTGALGITHTGSGSTSLAGVLFEKNRARTDGGAVGITGNPASNIIFQNVIFSNNWAGRVGGAVWSNQNDTAFTIAMTDSGGTSNYSYAGNIAASDTTAVTDAMLDGSDTAMPIAQAKGGGFYYATLASSMELDIADGVALSIGLATGTNKAVDSIASAGNGARIIKSGSGDLILNADNSYWQGGVAVNAGRLILGNSDAKLGGAITLESGAAFGGVGTLQAFAQNGAEGIVSLTARAGSILQVGADGAVAGQSLAFSRTGSNALTLEGGVSLAFDLFGSNGAAGTYDQIIADLLTADTGTNTLNITGLGSASSYTLISSSSFTGDASNFSLNITGTLAGGPRTIVSTSLAKSGQDLVLNNTLSNLALVWTGSESAQWSTAAANWADVLPVPAETRFATGDAVTFDSTADTTNPAHRTITVAGEGVTVSGMKVEGDGSYTFTGGGITINAASADAGFSGTTGKLEKSGTGTLTFDNAGANAFAGITHNDGRIAVSVAGQLGARLGVVIFGGGTATAPRIVINDNLTFLGESGTNNNSRLNMASIASPANAVNGGFLVAEGKTLAFEDIKSTSGGGVLFIGNNNDFEIISATGTGAMEVLFKNNSSLANGGAMQTGANSKVRLDNATFEGNAASGAARVGGAINNSQASSLLTLNNAIFTGNTATGTGGAIYNTGTLILNLATSATYAGNTAASAASGGFLYQNGAAARAAIDISGSQTLVIGSASDTAKDTLASSHATSAIDKNGAGALVLHADSSAYTAAFNVNAGSLLLGNAGAKLGGAVTTGSGALFGGAGAYTGAVIAQAGSILQVGADHSAAGDPALAEQLSIENLTLQGATLKFDLFEQDAIRTADKLTVATLAAVTGSNIIDVSRFLLGSGTIITVNGGAAGVDDLENLAVTIGGRVQSGARQIMRLSTSGNDLVVTGSSDDSRALTWTGTGAAATTWDDASRNWSGSNDVTTFAEGDKVVFNDTDSLPATHAIAIAGSSITVSGMEVDGAADYSFTGAAITADAASKIGSEAFTATGKLVKSGAGKLTLANTGTNDFKGGIDLNSGTLALASAGASGTSPITVGGAATLQAGIDALALANTIDLGANTLTIDTQAHATTLSGAIAGTTGGLAKIGTGTLTLTAANTHAGNTTLAAGVLALGHNNALGTGTLVNAGNATVRLAAADLALANAIALGASANTLVLDTAANSGTLAGVISGDGGLAKIGTGTLALTGGNTFAGALAVNEGALVAATASALGSANGTVAVGSAGTLDIATAASSPFSFTRALAGNGIVNINLAATADAFSFANNTSTFTGTLRLNKGTLTLDENAAAALSGAGANLVLNADAVAQKSGAAFTIATLTLAGGRLDIETVGGVPVGKLLTVATLDLGTGSTSIGVDASQYSGTQYNPAVPPALNLLDQDGAANVRLVAAGAVTGSGDVTLTALDGSALAAATASVVQTIGGTVATASYSYAASKQTDGIYMGYGLSQIDIHDGKTLILDNTSATDSTLSAVLTGSGAVEINAAGAITLERQNTHTGTTIVNTGTLKAGVGNAFAASTSVDVKSGAALDLGGHDQTAQNLTGAGAVLLGSSTLTAQNTGTTAFSGAFSGAGKLVKTGAGKLSLTGSSAHTGGVDLAAGTLGLGHNAALGTGTLAVTAASGSGGTGVPPVLYLDADGLAIANAINLGASGLTLDAGANNAALAGVIGGAGALTLDGTGTIGLAGANTFSGGLHINTARVVAANHASAIGAGAVAIGATSTLEFRDIVSGSVNNALTGNAVEIGNSTLAFGGANALQRLTLSQGANLTAGVAGALGGATSDVAVNNGGTLNLGVANTAAKNLTVAAGGKLVFNAIADGQPMLNLAGALTLQASSTLALGMVTSGSHTLARAASGITDNGVVYDTGPNTGMDVTAFAIDGDGNLIVGAVNQAANPGKDIAVAFDAMTASITAVYSRLGESFLNARTGRRSNDPANSFWIKGIGTFGDRDGGDGRIGYKDDAYGAIAGFDYAVSEKFLIGAYAGFSHVKIRTDNQAETNADLPYGGAYGVMRFGPVYIAGDITIGTFDADTSRFEQTGYATGEYNAYTAGGGVEIGTVLAAWKNGTIKPAVAVRYMSLDYHEQSETGPGAILVDNFKTERWEGLASVQVSQGFATPWKLPGVFDLLLGWRAALKDEQNHLAAAFAASPADTFTLIGDNYDRGAFMAGLGVRFAITRNSLFSAGYDYETGSDYNRHSVNAVIRLAW
ncbi:autotransporter-associated beta strand repeat-containing protein [Termitidicoccus mucosus]|uniref:Autotransporter domain-containing protein n=1 Tax=Termitidicoccus mucosus TaxID=1184151 RepID=A0A178IIX0_9BACT|nr:hypothetical protein AW736_14575 [Opitutaceae bacterium TSB47]